MRIAENDSATGIRYYHKDHLSSSTAVTDASGSLVKRIAYAPYGEESASTGTAEVAYKFTDKEEDNTDLYYFGARYYDPEMGRFLSVDPAEDGDNWYAYCNDNPVKYVDPDGRISLDTVKIIKRDLMIWAGKKLEGQINWLGRHLEKIAFENSPFTNWVEAASGEEIFTNNKLSEAERKTRASKGKELFFGGLLGLGTNGLGKARVGQWMTKIEYEQFGKTGIIPRTNVLTKGKEGYMKQANDGDYYVEFDVDSSLLKTKNEELGWSLVKSKNDMFKKLAEKKGDSLPEPIGENITHVTTK